MLDCKLMIKGECRCNMECAKLKAYRQAYAEIRETLARLVACEVIDLDTYELIMTQIGEKNE